MNTGYFGESPYGPDTNVLPSSNLYPGSGGGTLAQIGSTASPTSMRYAIDPSAPSGTTAVAATPSPADSSAVGHPLTWWVAIAILVAAIFFTARKTGNAGEFSNLRASTYNIALITFIAILGITMAKILAVKVKGVPGLSGLASVVIAA